MSDETALPPAALTWLHRAVLVTALLAEAAGLLMITKPWHPLSGRDVLSYEVFAAMFFCSALLALPRCGLRPRAGVMLVFVVAFALNIIGLLSAPTSSDDDFRYAWDAKVQLAGIDPYRYAPADPHLAPLHEPFLFPPARPCTRHEAPGDVCAEINRPTVHTIYPPVAQAAFVAMRAASLGGKGGHLPLQIAEILASLGVAVLLARAGAQLWQVALWAWCPITVLELANNAHIEGVAVLLSIAAVVAARDGKVKASGLWLGAAIATKLYPALLLPALLRRRPLVVAATTVSFVVLSYLPHIAVVGKDVIGYLPGYLHEGDYLSGGRFLLLGLVMPHSVAPYVAAVLLLAAAFWVWRNADPKQPERGALYLVGMFFLIATPNLSWYSLLLLALAAFAARPEWLLVIAAPTVIYLGVKRGWDPTVVGPLFYGLGAVIVLSAVLARIALQNNDIWARGSRLPTPR